MTRRRIGACRGKQRTGFQRIERGCESREQFIFAFGRDLIEDAEIETRLFDVRDFDLPRDEYGTEIGDRFPEWRDAIIRADGLVIVTPEYNHGYPGFLKHALDTNLKEYIHKAVGICGVSAGPFGGTRVIENMLPVMRELGLVAIFWDVNFSSVQNAFDGTGKLLDEAYVRRAEKFIKELVWMAKVLRYGRENVEI